MNRAELLNSFEHEVFQLKINSSVEGRNRDRNQCQIRMPIAGVRRACSQLLRVASVCKLIENNSSAKRMRASCRGKCGRRVRQPEEIPNRIRGPGFVEFRPRRDASICKCARARCGIFSQPPSLSLSLSLSLPLFTFSPIAFRVFELVARELSWRIGEKWSR